MSIALIIVAAGFALAIGLGLYARLGREMGLEQWTVGGRGFGTALVFLLMAGEIYTTFTFLGGSGIAYGKGGPAYYILCYLTLAYVTSYWLLPPVWRYAKQNRLYTQPDFFARKYDSPALGMLVAAVGIVALVPYLVLQLKGLGIIVSTASYGAIPATMAIWIGAAALTAYVVVSGVHGSAWTAVVKDTSILLVVLFLGIYLPLHFYGSYGGLFRAIEAAKPGFLALPESGQSPVWFSTTVLLTALGGYMWPHTFASLYTAREPGAFRRNAVILPLYQLINLFVFMIGFTAVLQVPGLTGPDVDLSLFKLSLASFPPWVIGLIGATGVLTALVPGSMILIAGATLVANNLVRPLRPAMDDAATARLCKILVPILALVCVGFTLQGGDTIVQLLLMGYNFVTQLFPCFIASLMRRNPLSRPAAAAGIVAGVATVAVTVLAGFSLSKLPFLGPLQDVNVGVAALAVNLVVTAVFAFVTRTGEEARTQAA
ncbi:MULTISPECIES: sodium:solute symporter family protein [unclassified Methylobacterium]|jgi:solute:Na+ symporter, SSS family|uniref:sodium:solute symporter family protein n=1 Tax=unclassified Methylobacterium TaxID=2615210 RepID=UPI0013545B38|nr:sodium:solute symporter [Methylobacterium sp. 2A]MWV22853.1 sodium:solute symporter [Methylobacterium sp. 2A]